MSLKITYKKYQQIPKMFFRLFVVLTVINISSTSRVACYKSPNFERGTTIWRDTTNASCVACYTTKSGTKGCYSSIDECERGPKNCFRKRGSKICCCDTKKCNNRDKRIKGHPQIEKTMKCYVESSIHNKTIVAGCKSCQTLLGKNTVNRFCSKSSCKNREKNCPNSTRKPFCCCEGRLCNKTILKKKLKRRKIIKSC